jgi:hypothetical protein
MDKGEFKLKIKGEAEYRGEDKNCYSSSTEENYSQLGNEYKV